MFVLAATMGRAPVGSCVKTSLDALLAALYVFIDDHVAPRRWIGRPPKLTDAEPLCLAVAQVLLGFPSARHWIRFAHARLGHLFRYLPSNPPTTSASTPPDRSSAT
jgi:hypothetical protein